MKYKIVENSLKTEDFLNLFESAGWGSPLYDIAETSIKNSYATFCVMDGDKVIAMSRLLGDGGMAFFLKDLVVLPEYQGQGIGKMLLTYMEELIKTQIKPGWEARFQLMSAKGKEPFYNKIGYTQHPHEHSGAGFTKMIVK